MNKRRRKLDMLYDVTEKLDPDSPGAIDRLRLILVQVIDELRDTDNVLRDHLEETQ